MSPGGFPILGGEATYGVSATAESVQKVGIHLGGGGKRGGAV